MGLTTDVGDRLHQINQSIDGATALRYFPTNFDTARLPFIVPLVGSETKRVLSAGGQAFSADRSWTLLLIVGTWTGRIPTESVSKEAERLIDAVIETYITRPRLDYDGEPLDWVERAELGSDDGIFAYENDYAALRFPLTVTTRRTFTYNTSR